MSETHLLSKFRLGQFLRFCISGLGATICHTLVVLMAVHGMGSSIALANFCAFLMAASFSYVANTLWSFESFLSKKNAILFFLATSICAALAAVIAHLVDITGYSLFIGIFAVVVVTTPISFLLHKYWTFAPSTHV
jgi:putative flippase GtrA